MSHPPPAVLAVSIPEILALGEFAVRILMVIVVLVRKASRPSVAAGWLVLVLAVPFLGAFLYFTVGETRFGRRRIERHATILTRIDQPWLRQYESPHAAIPESSPIPRELASVATKVAFGEPRGGHRLRLFSNSDESIDAIIAEVDRATDHCHLLFYIWLDDATGRRLGEALSSAAARGVACRVLLDAVGSKQFLRSETRRAMQAAGVEVEAALPVNVVRMLLSRLDLRNHRKIAVIDGRVGFTGSQNVADASFAPKAKFAPWIDCMVRIEGPAVRALQTIFVIDWLLDAAPSRAELPVERVLSIEPPCHADGVVAQVIATGPNYHQHAVTQIVQAIVHLARRELVLTTPYFVPDGATLTNLAVAARRGVDVRLVVPARNDSRLVDLASRALRRPLLEAGVSIEEFHGGLLHAKTIVADDEVGVVMSANLDLRSYELNFECGLLVFDEGFAKELRALQRSYQARATPAPVDSIGERPLHVRLAEGLASVMSPLL